MQSDEGSGVLDPCGSGRRRASPLPAKARWEIPDRAQLAKIEVELDQCWDLLRQSLAALRCRREP